MSGAETRIKGEILTDVLGRKNDGKEPLGRSSLALEDIVEKDLDSINLIL
jgi:hypothetical protein